jgi:hypothetical protein
MSSEAVFRVVDLVCGGGYLLVARTLYRQAGVVAGSGSIPTATPPADSERAILAACGLRALRRAVTAVEAAYRQQVGGDAPASAFAQVDAWIDQVAMASPAPILTDVERIGLTNSADLEQDIIRLLADLLPDESTRRQRHWLERLLLPQMACHLGKELLDDTLAAQVFRRLMLADLPIPSGDQRSFRDLLQRTHAALNEQVTRLVQEMANTDQSAREVYVQSAVAEAGGRADVRNEGIVAELPAGGADKTFVGSAVARGPGSQATAFNNISPNPAPASSSSAPALVLTLTFTPTADGARVTWYADEIGSWTSTLVLPFQGTDLAAVMHALESRQHPMFQPTPADIEHLRGRGLVNDHDRVVDDLERQIGQALYRALVSGQGLVALTNATSQATTTGRPLTLRLLFPPDAVKLAALPWELIWQPGQAKPFIFQGAHQVQITRHLLLDRALASLTPRQGRLRVHSLVPHTGRSPAEVADIRRHLTTLWNDLAGVVDLHEDSPVTVDHLNRIGESQPDIVQFTGHGWYADGQGVLLLDPATPGAPAARITADRLAVALRSVRMVVLAACRSASIADGNARMDSSLALALSAIGVPVVVGMQLGIRVTSAITALQTLYRTLAQGQSVQFAVERIRETLYIAGDPAWYVPTLYIAAREVGPVRV